MNVLLHKVRVGPEALAEAKRPSKKEHAIRLDLCAQQAQVVMSGGPAHGCLYRCQRGGHHIKLHATHKGHHRLDIDAV